jgi:hypothetical protein
MANVGKDNSFRPIGPGNSLAVLSGKYQSFFDPITKTGIFVLTAKGQLGLNILLRALSDSGCSD